MTIYSGFSHEKWWFSITEGNDGFSFAIVVRGSAGGLNICPLQTKQCFKQPSSIRPAASIFLQELRPRKFSRTEVWLTIPNSQLKTVQFLVCQRLRGFKYWCTFCIVCMVLGESHVLLISETQLMLLAVVKQSCSKLFRSFFLTGQHPWSAIKSVHLNCSQKSER